MSRAGGSPEVSRAEGRPELTGLTVADPPERWARLGFAVAGACTQVARVRIELGAAGEGITSWTLSGLAGGGELDGLPTRRSPAHEVAAEHPNGVLAVDHLVVITPDFDRTAAALAARRLQLRRVREARHEGRSLRQGFRRLGRPILELVEAGEMSAGPARFWGVTFTVADLDRLAQRLGDDLGEIHPAVQPGRRIATLRRTAGLGPAVAFMDAEGGE